MYSIGDIARLGGVSARMLRHYDEIGLFHPAAVDANGYRRYHPAQLARLHRIVALRDLGFGLDAIAELVGGDISPDKLWGMLRLRQDELEAERAVLEGRLHRLSRHLVRLDQTVQGGTPMAELAVTTTTLDGLHVAELSSISPTFDPSDIGPPCRRCIHNFLNVWSPPVSSFRGSRLPTTTMTPVAASSCTPPPLSPAT